MYKSSIVTIDTINIFASVVHPGFWGRGLIILKQNLQYFFSHLLPHSWCLFVSCIVWHSPIFIVRKNELLLMSICLVVSYNIITYVIIFNKFICVNILVFIALNLKANYINRLSIFISLILSSHSDANYIIFNQF